MSSEQAGVRGASWNEGSELERAGSELGSWRELGASWE